MATNYTYESFVYEDLNYYVLKTKASNIQLVSLNKQYGSDQFIKNTGYYGMNASFFNLSNSELDNIAYQNGNPVGPGTQGSTNGCGSGLISWDGSNLKFRDGVKNVSGSFLNGYGTWAQGGYGLYLCDPNWGIKFTGQGGSELLDGGAPRTGILINESTNYVYLFICTSYFGTVAGLRGAMMNYAGIFEGLNPYGFKAILTDGGRSAQFMCAEKYVQAPLSRAVPQIIALVNKT